MELMIYYDIHCEWPLLLERNLESKSEVNFLGLEGTDHLTNHKDFWFFLRLP